MEQWQDCGAGYDKKRGLRMYAKAWPHFVQCDDSTETIVLLQ